MTDFNSTAIATFVLKNIPIVTTMEPELMFAYNKEDGYWRKDKVAQRLKQTLQSIIPDVNQYKVKEVIEAIKRITYKDWKPIDTTQNLVSLKNGILDIETGALYKPSPDLWVTWHLPVNYVADIDTTEWGNYVKSSVGVLNQLKLQEAIGNIFAPHYETKKIVYLYGKEDTGKSTFIQMIQIFLGGIDNGVFSTLDLKDLGERFRIAHLYGKRANFCADVSYKIKIRDYGKIKMLTGGDSFTAEFKHKDAFSFKNDAKIFFSGNGIPQVDEKQADRPFYRRWEFIKFPHTFTPDEKFISNHTTDTMLSQILKWALDGYERLRDNNWHYTNETDIDEAILIFNQGKESSIKQDSVLQWMFERCSTDGIETKENLYDDCVAWHKNKELPTYPANLTHFGRAMMGQKAIPIIDCKKDDKPSYRGIRLRPKTDYWDYED